MPQIDDIARFAFIVGAPRCGTTTLANFLKAHPDVCFPMMKEPHYFAQHDLTGLSFPELVETVESEYLARYFPHCHGSAHTAADCSVSYLYAPEQLEPVLRLWPDSRFVITLRDPMDMLPSLHKRLLFLGDETLTRFEDAWTAAPDRAAGKRIPRKCIEPRWLRYDEAARYSTYLERLFATVGRERCLVLLFDDLAADPLGQYRQLADFLGLTPLEQTIELTPRRRSHDVRSIWLQRLLKRPPKPVRKYLAGPYQRKRERELGGEHSDGAALNAVFSLRKRLLHWNRIPAQRQSIPIKVQQQIREQFSGDIERLESLTGRDLGHWLQLSPEAEGTKSRNSSARLRPSLTAAE
ncbi:MAG TPA: sulfotransferase [Sphingomicrobium sp.]|nr:sulfotransferase [Sphingomicrobium sp.]